MQYNAFELRPLAQRVEYFGQANVIPLAACGRKRPSVAAQHFIKRVEGARAVLRILKAYATRTPVGPCDWQSKGGSVRRPRSHLQRTRCAKMGVPHSRGDSHRAAA